MFLEPPLIRVENVVKRYLRGGESLIVLNGLCLTIQKGEFISLMGPSGSGKTTLLNLIAGLDSPDEGEVYVNEIPLSTLSQRQLSAWRAREVGFIFQFYNLIPILSALENVALPLSLLQMPRHEQLTRATVALRLVGLGDRMNHFPRQLSGGQEQRVAIARALVTDPTIIVADEPTGDLDRASAADILSLLTRCNEKLGTTIIMVTHDSSAAQYASRQIHLDKGILASSS
jgi:putative ABC transport system ATP-binding protein